MRWFTRLLLIVGAAAAWSAARAETRTIGVICHCRADFPTLKAFEAGLAALGWADPAKAKIVRRTSDGDVTRLARDAEELVRMNPHVIFAGFTPAVVAVQKHTAKIPVVFAGVSDPIEIGASTQIAKPDRNFTGVSTMNRELMPKRLELLKEASPQLNVVGYLANPRYALHQTQLEEIEAAASRLGLTLVTVEARTPADFERAFAELTSRRAQALLVQQDPLFTGQPTRILDLVKSHRLPAIYPLRSYFDAGGMMWYGADIAGQFRRAATYVDQILKGAHPGTIPIERPAKFTLTINLKLAKEIGFAINPTLLVHADEVIE